MWNVFSVTSTFLVRLAICSHGCGHLRIVGYKSWLNRLLLNYIQTNTNQSMPGVSIAVFGLSGALGASTLEALQSSTFASKIQYPIKAFSRKEHDSTNKVQYFKTDLTNVDELIEILKGTDVIIDLLAVNPTAFAAVDKIVTSVKPKFFIPSQFGVDIEAVQKYAPGFLGLKSTRSKALREAGIKVVDVLTSYFAIPGSFLYEVVGVAGIDPKTQSYNVKGDLDTEISVSTNSDIGKSLAALATTDVSTVPDIVKIYSEKVTIGKVVSTYEKDHDVKLKLTETQTAEEALTEFKTVWAKGFDSNKFLYYLHVVASQGVDKGANFGANQRELVNPGESLWTWGKF